MSRLRRRPVALAALLTVYLALAVLVKLPVWQAPLTTYGGTADVEQKMWFFTWIPYAISHHHNPLFTTYMNYPAGVNMMWNTPMPAVGLLVWPITATLGPVLSYNVVTTAALALAAFFAFFAIRRYVTSNLAAAFGALLYGFSPGMISQSSGHASPVVSAVTVPLVLLLLDELLVRQRFRPYLLGVLIGSLGILQFFIFEEFFVFEVMIGALVTLILALMYRRLVPARRAYVLGALWPAVLMVLLVIAYPLYVQFAGPQAVTHSLHDPNGFSTDLLNPVLPTGFQWIAPSAVTSVSAGFSGNNSEADAYLGLPLLVLLVFVTVRWWRVPVVRAAACLAIVLAVFSLGPNLHVANQQLPIPLPWWLPGHVPVLRSLLPSRMMLPAFLPIGLLLAHAMHRLWVARHNLAVSALMPALVAVPLLPALPLPYSTLSIPRYFQSPAVRDIPSGSAVLTVPWPGVTQMQGLDWQVAAGMQYRVLGGYYIGPASTGQDLLYIVATSFEGPTVRDFSAPAVGAQFLRELHASQVGAVIVGSVPDHAEAVSFMSSVLGPPHAEDGDIDVWLVGEGS